MNVLHELMITVGAITSFKTSFHDNFQMEKAVF